MNMTVDIAWDIVGGLSSPSKMPCHGFSIPASKCITGGKMRLIEDSVCSKCYAMKGRYVFGVVKAALLRRFENLNHPLWTDAMAFLILNLEKSGYFRWFDSGDLQSVEHLKRIVEVCEATPSVQHWLPTREYSIVDDYLQEYKTLPKNLTIRLSALMLNSPPPTLIAKRLGLVTSGVVENDFSCLAPSQGGKCLTCRACWDKNVENVNYQVH